MTKILITGAAGFLGTRLTLDMLADPTFTGPDGGPTAITEIVLADLVKAEIPELTGANRGAVKFTHMTGSLTDPTFLDRLMAERPDSIFHLASQLTLQAELDPALAYRTNVAALRTMMERAENKPALVFTSSIAVYGGDLPDRVTERIAPAPSTTYGTHKAVNELLVADYSRRGQVDGRSLRLPIVLTRPGNPQPVVSDQVASIIREPLNARNVTVPLSENTKVPLASAGTVVRALRRIQAVPAKNMPESRAVNLPALTVTVRDMAEAAARAGATGRVDYAPSPKTQSIVDGWPANFLSDHAEDLGIAPEPGIDALISDYLDHKDN